VHLTPFFYFSFIFFYLFFSQKVSGVYTSAVLDTDDLKMALRARKLSGAFEKRAPELHCMFGHNPKM